jgi:hypothetical protein
LIFVSIRCVHCKRYRIEPFLINGRVHRHNAEAGVYPHFEKKTITYGSYVKPLTSV